MTTNRFQPKRLIVPVDLFEPCGPAAETGRDLALRFGARLDLVFVYPMPQAWGWPEEFFPLPPAPAGTELERHWAREKLRQWARGLPPGRARERSYIGPPAAVLSSLARKAGPGALVVMGTHGFAGIERALAGSVAEAVVARSTAPVLVLRDQRKAFKPGRVLAPWNGEPYADRALRLAASAASAFGARLTVLLVLPRASTKSEPDLARLERLLGGPRAFDLKDRAGDPRREILAEAEAGRFGLVVLSAHRKPFWRRRALGSTAEHVLRHCAVPVLAVPSGGGG